MRLTDLPIERPVATLMLLASLTLLGAVAVFRLPLDFMPAVESPEVEITLPWPGSHPLEMLRQVTDPIEEEVATVADLKELYSESGSGRASVTAVFEPTSNMDLKKLEVREAVERVRGRLPEGVGQIRIESWSRGPGSGAILEGRISAKRDLSESWELLDRRIRRPLERIRGVARVQLEGVAAPQVRIELNLDACLRHGVSPQAVMAAVQAANVDLDLGSMTDGVLRYDVRSIGRFARPEEIAGLQLDTWAEDGRSVRVQLADVAQVVVDEPRLDYGRHLDRDFAISIDVYKEPSANTVETVDRLMARIAEIERDPELEGIKLLVWDDAGKEIRASIHNLRDAGIFGGFLAAVVLFVFLRHVRTTLVVSVAIPFSLLVTCGGMYLFDSQFNVLTMLGLMLGVGMLVDNAVVVVENIFRLQSLGMPPMEAAKQGAREVSLAVVASTATSIIVWAWLLVTPPSQMVTYLGAVALTICLAVGCSLLISLTFIPLMAARMPAPPAAGGGLLERRVLPVYHRFLRFTLRHRGWTLLALLLLAGSAYFPFQALEMEGEPKMREEFVTLSYSSPEQIDLALMEAHVNQVETWIEGMKDELGYTSLYSYYNENGWGITRIYVPLERANDADLAALKERLRPGLPVIPGITLSLAERNWWRNRGSGKWVQADLHGEDPEFLREKAVEAEAALRQLDGVHEVYGPTLRGEHEARVVVDPERALALGISPRLVAETVAFTFRGRGLRRFQSESGELEVRLGLPDDAKPGLASLRDLPLRTLSGQEVPLGAVATIEMARTDDEIDREDRQTTTRVALELDPDRDVEAAKAEVQAVMDRLGLPEGYSWDFGSWNRRNDEGLSTMAQGVALSLCAVLLLMAALFESFTQPLAILITLPLAFFGGLWALWWGDYTLDMVGFMGVIILIGIVVNNGIVMVDHVNQLREQGMDRVEALVEGCGDRLRPVLMTAITTLFGLVPLGMSQFTIAGVYIDSLAVVVIGGLTTSTVFTLLALPVWYATLEDVGLAFLRSLPRRRASSTSPAA